MFTHHIRWVPFELTAALIDKDKFDIDYFILGSNDPIINFLRAHNIGFKCHDFIDYSNTPEAVKLVYDHLVANKTDIVQTHWFAGSLVGIQAAYYANVPVRIFHREHPPLCFYSRHSTSKHRLIWDCCSHVIAVTNKSKLGMIEDGIQADKISVIPTGFDPEGFLSVTRERVDSLKERYLATTALKARHPVIGVAARYVKWKGIEYVIEAFREVLSHYPQALLILSGSHVDRSLLEDSIKNSSLGDIVSPPYRDALNIIDTLSRLPDESYLEIPFEEDVYSLFRMFDVFVHAPVDDIQETFGQVYVEAMFSKVPSVVTLSGSALDHAIHRETAWVVDYMNSSQIATGIMALLDDSELRRSIVENAFAYALEHYSIGKHMRSLEDLYLHLWRTATSESDPSC